MELDIPAPDLVFDDAAYDSLWRETSHQLALEIGGKRQLDIYRNDFMICGIWFRRRTPRTAAREDYDYEVQTQANDR